MELLVIKRWIAVTYMAVVQANLFIGKAFGFALPSRADGARLPRGFRNR